MIGVAIIAFNLRSKIGWGVVAVSLIAISVGWSVGWGWWYGH
jgi:hypothetical protein